MKCHEDSDLRGFIVLGAIQGSDEGKIFCDQVNPVSGSVEMLNGPTIQVPFQKHLLPKRYQKINVSIR